MYTVLYFIGIHLTAIGIAGAVSANGAAIFLGLAVAAYGLAVGLIMYLDRTTVCSWCGHVKGGDSMKQ